MNAQMNGLLEQIRTQLVTEVEGGGEGGGEEAFGPDSSQDTTHSASEPGEGGADNVSDAFDTFDMFMDDIVTDLLAKYDMEEDDAVDFVFSVADDMVEEGLIPAIPEEDASDADVAKWLGVAKTAGFEARVAFDANEAAEG